MNILQTFYILFKSDAEKVQKETAAAERSAEKLAGALDVAGDQGTQAGAQIAAGMNEAAGAAARTGAAVASTGQAIAAAAGAANTALHGQADAHVIAWRAAMKHAEGEAFVAKRMGLTVSEGLNLSRQFADIAVTGAMGMNPFMIAIQQGPQVLDIFTQARIRGVGFRDVLADIGSTAARFVKPLSAFLLPVAGLIALFAATSIAKGQVDDLLAIGQTAEKLRDTVEDVDAVTRAIRNNGGTTKEATAQLDKFADKVKDAFADSKSAAAKAFAGVGVKVTGPDGGAKSTTAALADLAGALEGVSKKKAAATLDKLGITDPATTRLILSGRDAVNERIAAEKALGVTTSEQVARAKAYKHEVELLNDVFTDLKNIIAGAILPALTASTTAFRNMFEWIAKNRILVGAFAGTFLIAVTAMTAAIWLEYIPAIVAAAVSTVIAFAPFFLIAAAVVAVAAVIAAVFEDISFYLKGQPSLLGELINRYAWIKATIQGIGRAWDYMKEKGGAAWDAIKEGAAIFWEYAGPVFRLIGDAATALWPIVRLIGTLGFMFVGEVVKDLALGVWAFVKGALYGVGLIGTFLGKIVNFAKPLWDSMFQGWLTKIYLLIAGVRQLFGMKPDATVNRFLLGDTGALQGRAMLNAAGNTPFAAQTPASMAAQVGAGQRNNTFHFDKIDINTQATDADGIARGFSGALSDQLRWTTAAFDNGVER